jgi:cysteine desulfurase/selenocysteine lyase
MEHHSNIVPWQLVAEKTGALIRFVGLTEHETLDMEQFRHALSNRTKLVSIVHVSNTLGNAPARIKADVAPANAELSV